MQTNKIIVNEIEAGHFRCIEGMHRTRALQDLATEFKETWGKKLVEVQVHAPYTPEQEYLIATGTSLHMAVHVGQRLTLPFFSFIT